ncbi:MAG: polysaccharide lyase family 8 super-sandwich domain-containing protein [Cyclobacteriaceae bacterium]
MPACRLFIFSLLLFLLHLPAIAYEHPGGMHPKAQIDFVKQQIQQQTQPYYDAYLQLRTYADSALQHPHHALADFSVPGYYVKPKVHRKNSKSLQSDSFDAYASALAYQLTGEQQYADKARDFLMAWANINTQYSEFDGSLVMAYSGTGMIMAAELLLTYEGWKASDKDQFFSWVTNVYRKATDEIRHRKNNWADWGRLGSILSAHLLDDTAQVAENIRLMRSDLFHKIAEDGHMPEEVRREKNGIWYTYFSLAPITAACWVALQTKGTDLFTLQEGDKSIKSALDYLLYYQQHPDEWKWFENPNTGSPNTWPYNLMEAMHGIYGDEAYGDFAAEARPHSYPVHHFAWSFPTLMKPLRTYGDPDLETLRQRVVAELMQPEVDESEIDQLVASRQEDGRWPDINYEDVSRTGFEHARHLSNMTDLSRAYQKPSSKFYHDPKVKETLDASLNFWLEHNFICDNWWWNQIGTPDRLVSTLLIMDDELSEEQKEKAAPIVGRANLSAWGARPGGDLIKIAGILGKYSLFTRDSATLKTVIETMASEIALATSRNTPDDVRGLQADMSFHHRKDRVTSTLSYGLGYANAFAEWAAKVADTQFRFPEDRIELLVDFYLDGICKTMVHGKYFDPGAKNRGITRQGALLAQDADIPEKLLKATDYRQDELQAIVNIREGKAPPHLTHDKFFWHTEYLSHQRPEYFTSVRMFSSRNHTMEEPYNGEGLKNHHLGDGANFISRTGTEYIDIFPILDWQKIPGTTVVQKPELPAEEEIQKAGLTDFVGGVTDGAYGAAAFDFKSTLDPLEAKKAWFMFDQEYVCLGTGIHATAAYPVVTTLNQCYLNSDVLVLNKKGASAVERGNHTLKKVQGIVHDSVAYLFFSPTEVHLENEEARGSWFSINRQADSPKEEISRDVFTLWVDHGKKPKKATYEYMVVPNMDAAGVEAYRDRSPIQILANTPEIQAVQHTDLQISQVAFYEAGDIQLTDDLTLTMSTPGLAMLQMDGAQLKKLSVADPTRKLAAIHLKVSIPIDEQGDNYQAQWNEDEGYTEITIELPQGDYAGQSVTVTLQTSDKI